MLEDLDLIKQEIDYEIWVSYLDLCVENSRFSGLTTIQRIYSNIVNILILDDRTFSNVIGSIQVVARRNGDEYVYKILNFITFPSLQDDWVLNTKPLNIETIDFISPEQLKGVILDTFKTYYD